MLYGQRFSYWMVNMKVRTRRMQCRSTDDAKESDAKDSDNEDDVKDAEGKCYTDGVGHADGADDGGKYNVSDTMMKLKY